MRECATFSHLSKALKYKLILIIMKSAKLIVACVHLS